MRSTGGQPQRYPLKNGTIDKKPLAGKKILITRACDQAALFSSSLRNLGAEVIELYTIEIVPPASWKGLDRAINHETHYITIIREVHRNFDRLLEGREMK
jgi:uroporphyrinogen III methyltransferase/synthase